MTILILIAGCMVTHVNAQEISLVGGMNFSNMVDKNNNYNFAKEDNYKSRVGGHIGALIGFNLSDNISLQTGLLISTKGVKEVYEDKWEKEIYKINLTYLEVPLLVSYNYEINDDFKIYGGLGPVLGVAIGGKYIYKYIDKEDGESDKDVEKISFGNNEIRDGFKRLDVGLMVQAGAQYDKYRLGLFFNHGLLNQSNFTENGRKIKNKVFGISAAYVIDLKK